MLVNIVFMLKPSSAHPCHCSRSIPYSIAYRLRRLCSMVIEDEPASWMKLQDMRHRKISYVPNQLASVKEQFVKALSVSRDDALKKVSKIQKEDRLILSLPYDRRMTNVNSILHQHWSYSLKVNPDLKKAFPNPPMISYSRPKNLRDILVRSQLPKKLVSKDLRRRVGFKRCNMTRCETCPYTKNIKSHTCNYTNKSYNIKEELSCYTENTIYSLTCTKGSGTFSKKAGKKTKICPQTGSSEVKKDGGQQKILSCSHEAVYIGKTTQQFWQRMSQHRRSVSPVLGLCDATTPVGFHFALPGHELHHMQCIALEQVKSISISTRIFMDQNIPSNIPWSELPPGVIILSNFHF